MAFTQTDPPGRNTSDSALRLTMRVLQMLLLYLWYSTDIYDCLVSTEFGFNGPARVSAPRSENGALVRRPDAEGTVGAMGWRRAVSIMHGATARP